MYVDAAYCYRLSSVVCWLVCRSACRSSEPCKNGWTNRDAVWVEDSGGPREPRVRWGPNPPAKGQFWGEDGKGSWLQSIRTVCHQLCKSGWTDWHAVLVVDLDGTKEARIPSWGAHWRHLVNRVKPSTCTSGDTAFLWNYFDHLLRYHAVFLRRIVVLCP